MTTRLITIITPCYNEALNVREVHRRVMAMAAQPQLRDVTEACYVSYAV